ncbi:hypothetical protein BTO32_15170 [Marinobacter lutaoensis]|uniref:Integrase n=2 Tax=Marinobacter lutaoensis TaxID=135739 RepID=A0A1V2DPJ8_9GAMM|nr:hypothetical protein BTO32_15170 [Marinobacter lutaoensis]
MRLTAWQAQVIPTHQGPLAASGRIGWEATHDLQAVDLWLREVGSRSELTAEAYEREVRRFVLWLADAGKTITDVTREDFHRYASFLGNPGKKWICTKRYRLTDPRWRPFRKPLSEKSKLYSLQVIHSMLTWMHNSGWIQFNPMPAPNHLAPVTTSSRADMVETRQIPQRLFEELLEWCKDNLHTNSDSVRERYRNVRLRVVLMLAGYLGARSADIINAHFTDIHPRQHGDQVFHVWYIPDGKGRKSGLLPVHEKIMRVIREARLALGLMPDVAKAEAPCPIIVGAREIPHNRMPCLDKLKPIHRSSLYTLVSDALGKFAIYLRSLSRNSEAIIIEQASTHWLRHTAIKRVVLETKDITMAQRLARHENLNTTGVYATTSVYELQEFFGAHFSGSEQSSPTDSDY